jgi:signal peptidase II
MRNPVKFSHWLWLSGLVIALDQLAKLWISHHFQYAEQLPVLSVFSLVLAHNPGAAFSFLSDAGGLQRWLFSGIAVIASVWIFTLLRKHADQTLFALALSLVLGGALGNLIDRVAYGYVIDFLLFYWHGAYFPAFNLADSAITLGAVLLFFDGFKKDKNGTATR